MASDPNIDLIEPEFAVAAIKEETNSPMELKPSEKKALQELRARLKEAILCGHIFNDNEERSSHRRRARRMNSRTNAAAAVAMALTTVCSVDLKIDTLKDISLWGVPLLPSKAHDGTDVILLKFLKAREFKVAEALDMLRKTLRWRRENNVDGILSEDLSSAELDGMAYMDGTDRNGHPLCYNIYGAFKDKDLYQKTFGDEESCERFLRWRVQLMERGIKKLSFKPSGVGSIVQITDLKNSPGAGMKELQAATRKALSVLQENYPEFVTRNIFVNVSFRCYAHHALFSRFITQRTKSKFVFSRPSKVTETLLKFISPEKLPVHYGGLKREDDNEFSDEDSEVSEMSIRPGGTESIEIPIIEPGVTLVWDATVVGWEVNYKEEFIPDDEGSYKVLIQKEKRLEESVRNSFYINEPGKIVLTIENRTFKKKKALYRSKTKLTIPMYNINK